MFHGSFLLNFDLDLISKTLRSPVQQPDYRQNRAHQEFVTNLRIEAQEIEAALRRTWDSADSFWDNVPKEVTTRAEALVREKYSQPEWNRRF
jgi:lipoate-protein ligase A